MEKILNYFILAVVGFLTNEFTCLFMSSINLSQKEIFHPAHFILLDYIEKDKLKSNEGVVLSAKM